MTSVMNPTDGRISPLEMTGSIHPLAQDARSKEATAPPTPPTESKGGDLLPDKIRISGRVKIRRASIPRWNGTGTIALRLHNSGGVVRDHLSSERTFLAYVRTSLTVASAGVALTQALSLKALSAAGVMSPRIESFARPLGALTIAIALLILFMGVGRYFFIQSTLVKGYFPLSQIGVVSITLLLGTVITIAFGILLARQLEEPY